MEISWVVFATALAINWIWIGLMYVSQVLDKSLPSRLSIIPGTNQMFLYWQDFWTMSYGDTIGVALIAVGFAHLAVNGYLGPWQWVAFIAIALVSAAVFQKMCLSEDHKPDVCYPDIGKTSWFGVIHLPYFGVGIAISVMCIWNLIAGNLRGPVMWIALSGGAIYIICFVAEIKSGNFDPLNRISYTI